MFSRTLCLVALAIILVSGQSTSVATVYNDITDIDTNVKSLIAATETYTGDPLTSGPMLIDFVEVHLATRKGFYDSLLLPSELSVADSQSLITHVNHTLSIDNPAAVSTLESKKSYFQSEGLDPFIKGALELLLFDHLSFSDEVQKRIPESLQQSASEVIAVITNALENGISDFSS